MGVSQGYVKEHGFHLLFLSWDQMLYIYHRSVYT